MQSDAKLVQLRDKIALFPKGPGVYLMKDSTGVVLYVGKAGDLRARVGSYFQPSADLLASRGPEIARMADLVDDVDFLECETDGGGRPAPGGPAGQGHPAALQRHAQG